MLVPVHEAESRFMKDVMHRTVEGIMNNERFELKKMYKIIF